MEPGDKVIIKQNPHHPWIRNIIGTVIVYRPGEGFLECDLVDIHYKDPSTGEGHTMPFGLSCLGLADESSLISLAEHYQSLADGLRSIALKGITRRLPR